MDTLELEMKRMEIIRLLLDIDDSRKLDEIERMIYEDDTFEKKETEDILSWDEVRRDLDLAEQEEGGIPQEEVFAELEHKFPFLCG